MKAFFLTAVVIGSAFLVSCKKNKQEEVKPQDEIVYQTDFSVDDHTWFNFPDHTVKPLPDGYYELRQTQQNYQAWGIAPFGTINYDYAISADTRFFLDNDTKYGMAGLIFNFIDETHYSAFYICNDGTFYAFRNTGGMFTTLVTQTYSAKINYQLGALNVLEVRQYNTGANLFINGTSVKTLYSARPNGFPRAGVAVATYSSPYFTGVTGKFDNVTIKKIY